MIVNKINLLTNKTKKVTIKENVELRKALIKAMERKHNGFSKKVY